MRGRAIFLGRLVEPLPTLALYATAIFASALLLFQVQPIIGRLLLPWFGGSAVVWTTCMLFFQSALLAGYFYGFATHRTLPPRPRALLHGGLLVASLLALPILPDPSLRPTGGRGPVLPLLLLLGQTVGAPYLLLSATGPLFQDWFAARHPGRDPYRLFAWSNFASLLGLIAYPLLIEPLLSVSAQARLWSWGYRGFVLLGLAVAVDSLRAPAPASPAPGATSLGSAAPPRATIGPWTRLLWLLLGAVATVLLLGITNHLTANVAAIPLLWLLPLCLYLLTFTLAFARRRWYRRRLFLPLLFIALPLLVGLRLVDDPVGLRPAVAVLAGGLFVACMCLHGELSRLRPPPESLTEYYLLIALGGALGGLTVGVAAPLLLPSTYELEGAIALTAVLVLAALLRDPSVRGWFSSRRRRIPGALLAGAWVLGLAGVLAWGGVKTARRAHLMARGFYGALTIIDYGEPDDVEALRKLRNGEIMHGAQWRDPARAREPLTYYCPDSGVGRALKRRLGGGGQRVGAIGLGAGTLAGYNQPGDRLRFYEIDPLVERIARREFSYLATAAGEVEVVLGDARLSLEAEPDNRFDVLAVDAFAGDAIPIHLLTREAFALYARHLAPNGLLAIHVSNRYLDLRPVVADGAAVLGRAALLVVGEETPDDQPGFCLDSDWVVVMPEGETANPVWAGAKRAERRPGLRPWTDEYSNLATVLR